MCITFASGSCFAGGLFVGLFVVLAGFWLCCRLFLLLVITCCFVGLVLACSGLGVRFVVWWIICSSGWVSGWVCFCCCCFLGIRVWVFRAELLWFLVVTGCLIVLWFWFGLTCLYVWWIPCCGLCLCLVCFVGGVFAFCG